MDGNLRAINDVHNDMARAKINTGLYGHDAIEDTMSYYHGHSWTRAKTKEHGHSMGTMAGSMDGEV